MSSFVYRHALRGGKRRVRTEPKRTKRDLHAWVDASNTEPKPTRPKPRVDCGPPIGITRNGKFEQ